MTHLIDLIRPRVAKYGPVMIATIASQGFTALSLLALTLLGLGTSDIYIVALQAGNGAFTGIVLGVLYLFALGRPRITLWPAIAAGTSLFQIAFSIGSYFIYTGHGGQPGLPPLMVATIFAAFGIGGAALASIGVYAVRSALTGQPIFLAIVTLPSNAVLIVSIILVSLIRSSSPLLPLAPAILWCVCNIAIAAFLYGRYELARVHEKLAFNFSLHKLDIIHAGVLLTGVFSSTVIPSIYITSMSHLTTGTPTFIFIASRIGNAVVGLLINSFILVNYRWSGVGRKMDALILPPTAATAIILSLGVLVSPYVPTFVIYLLVFLSWITVVAAQLIATSEINAQKRHWTVGTKVLVDAIFSLAGAYFLLHHPTVTGFFAVNCISQLITLAIFGNALKSRGIVAAAIVGLAGAGFFLISGR